MGQHAWVLEVRPGYEEEYKKRFMNGFVSDYFQNSYKDLVAFFANEKKISADELKEIIKLIENPKK